MLVVEVLVAIAVVALSVPAAVYTLQCVLGSLPWRDRAAPPTARPPRVAVLVPAHNESSGIRDTVLDALRHLEAGDRLVVVADNCTDDTAAMAAAAARSAASPATFEVLERTDAEQRGKGHALAFGRAHLASDAPDVVVFVDADCRIARGRLRDLAAWAMARQCPVQADYLLRQPPGGTALTALGAFAVLVRNRVRPRGMARLGLPCQITGSGMALPWSLTKFTNELGGNIVEDLVMGLVAALAGHAPIACPEVRVVSELPPRDQDAGRQRRRWEHGQMATAATFAPRLLAHGLLRPRLLALALDLLVPPMALLVLLLLAATATAGALWLLTGATLPLLLAASAIAAVTLATLLAWLTHARDVLPLRQLLSIPFYVAWKIPLYLGFVKRREQSWQRTRRDTDRT